MSDILASRELRLELGRPLLRRLYAHMERFNSVQTDAEDGDLYDAGSDEDLGVVVRVLLEKALEDEERAAGLTAAMDGRLLTDAQLLERTRVALRRNLAELEGGQLLTDSARAVLGIALRRLRALSDAPDDLVLAARFEAALNRTQADEQR